MVQSSDVTITGLMINHDKIPDGYYYRFIFLNCIQLPRFEHLTINKYGPA